MCNVDRFLNLLLVIVVPLATEVTSEKTCSNGWQQRDGKCFYVSQSYANFYVAKENCESMTSELAPVYSLEDMKRLISVLIDPSPICNSYDNCAEYWIGVFDPTAQGIWTSINGTVIPEAQKFWATGYPKEKGYCVLFNLIPGRQDMAAAWANDRCARVLKYICVSSVGIIPTKTTAKTSKYQIISKNMTWTDAFSRCSSVDPSATLAIISSRPEDYVVKEFLKREIAKNAYGCTGFWIGAHRQYYNCQKAFFWQFQHGQESSVVYSAWDTNQPDCARGVEKCVQIGNPNFKWSDILCETTICALCESQ